MARKQPLKARLMSALVDMLDYTMEHGEPCDEGCGSSPEIWSDILREYDLTADEINGFKVENYTNSRTMKSWITNHVSNILSSLEYVAKMNEHCEKHK